MKKALFFSLFASLFLAACGTNQDTDNTRPTEKPDSVKRIWVRQSGKDCLLNADSLKRVFRAEDPIDSFELFLQDSLETATTFFAPPGSYEKISNDTEVICLMYPTYYHQHSREGESGPSAGSIKIHFLKKQMIQRDTLYYSGVSGDERWHDTKLEKRTLKKNSFFIEVESAIGYNNSYHQSASAREAALWLSDVLRRKNKKPEEVYDEDMEANSAARVSYTSMQCTH